jgi:hypothetical protein
MHQLSLRYVVVALTGLCLVFNPLSDVVQQADANIALEPSTLSLEGGETGEVAVVVYDVTDLAGAEFHLTFDADAVEVVDADPSTEGAQIADGGFLSADFVAQNQADNSAGTIDYAVARMAPNAPANGDGRLAVITFQARDGGGDAAVVLQDVLLADSDGLPIETVIISTGPDPGDGGGGSGCTSAPAIAVGAVALYFLSRKRHTIGPQQVMRR